MILGAYNTLSHLTPAWNRESPEIAFRPALSCSTGSGGASHWCLMKRRSAFTIVELLVVISIIAVLFTLTVKVVGAFVNNARESATQATLHKIRGALRERHEAHSRLMARKGFLSSQSESLLAKFVPGTTGRHWNPIARKLMQRNLFPQSYQEVLDADRMLGMQRYPNISAAPSASGSEILYAFLIQNAVMGDLPAEMDSFSPQEVRDTDGNGLLEFVDGWGRPLRYYRWPTRFIQSPEALLKIPNLPNQLNHDQDDPLGQLSQVQNFETIGVPADGKIITAPFNGPLFHTPQVYHIDFVVSAGEDGKFGLKDPAETPNTTPASYGYLGEIDDVDALMDDIFSVIRVGGR